MKDTVVSGSLRATDTIYSTTNQFQILRIPTASNGTTYGPGTNGQVLKSNGTSVYWASDNNTTALTSMTGTLGVDHGGTGATTASGARTNLGLGSMATETATDYLKWQATSITTANTIYDFGVYVKQGSADTSTTPTGNGYYNILNVPYRKANGNTKADYAWSIATSTGNDHRLFFRTSGADAYGAWQEVAHAPVGTDAIGGATQPVYMTAKGVITAGTALKALAYKDSLVAADIPTEISITGNAATATKSGVSDIWLYPENSNEINFGGATSSTTIFIGYRAKDSRSIPTKFIFGGTTGTADLQAKQVYLGSGTSSYISSTTYTGTAANASAVPLTGVTGADDLKAIEALSGTSGFLKKTAANTWTLDTNTYLTSSTGVTSIEGKTGAVTRVDLGIVYSTDTPSSPTEGMIWLKPI